MKSFIRINHVDNVVVALEPLNKGTVIDVDGELITLVTDIPSGHKCALKNFDEGENIVKYGFPIGHARHSIRQGSLLDHNDIATNLSGTLNYSNIHPSFADTPLLRRAGEGLFFGYARPDGQVGIRNEVWVIPTVGCVNGIAKQIVERTKKETGVDDIFYFTHTYGCSQLSEDHENTKKILRGMVHHPNAGAILVIGLGCENNQPRVFEEFCGEYDRERVRFMVCQDIDGDEVEYGVEQLKELVAIAQKTVRTPQPLSKLRVGLKCGGSDGFSGITANPLLGAFSDFLCEQQGGTTVLTEVPEMFGAETILMERSESEEVLQQTIALINNFKDYFLSHGEPCGENPSPGNKAGGISTLEEKALGCTQKSGNSIVRGVMEYGDLLQKNGLNLLSAPGNDLVASTALAAAGCQMVLFTTGRGTPFGSFVPTLKVSTNTDLSQRKPKWIDFNAGVLIEDQDMSTTLSAFIDKVLNVANGEPTCNECADIHEISIFKNGVTL